VLEWSLGAVVVERATKGQPQSLGPTPKGVAVADTHNPNHDPTIAGSFPRLRSGCGEKRPQTRRARRTNTPLELPAALRGKGNSPEGRRWRDLCRYYGNKLGTQRLADEATRARLLNLIWLTLELERIRDAPITQQPPIHTVLHLSQEQRVLLAELGLNESTTASPVASSSLTEYLAAGVAE
jgi:hypothetical protein